MKPSEIADFPELVYKYRSWSDPYHQKVITDNELYLASPKEFNDPFDCGIPLDFTSLDSKEKIVDYADQVIERQKNAILRKGHRPKDYWDTIVNNLSNDLIGFQERQEHRNIELRNEYYGVLALSQRWDSILMWAHYGDYHKGYCVGFYEEKLRGSGRFGSGGKVMYNHEMPRIDPREGLKNETHYIETHIKSEDWSYEEEYRLMKNFFDQGDHPNRVAIVTDDCFCDITIGLNTPEKDKEEIISYAKKKNLKVFQVNKVPFKFGLSRQEIA